ncbi:hypothetical protein [Stenotrophomonas sp. GZD-301]|uniref:hypothetical protein n=1 Tax=Stenotrophomonas sp. GZD-301 TaxID=3404814 RepID=UPI003BB8142F
MNAASGHPGLFNGQTVTTRCERLGDYAQLTCYGRSANGASVVGCSGRDPFYVWPLENSCEKRGDWNGPYPYLTGGKPRNGSVTCNAGCKQAWFSNGDGYFNGKYTSVPGTCNDFDDDKCKAQFGNGYYFNAAMSSCEPDEGKCPGGGATNSLGECKPEPCPSGKLMQPDGTCKPKENECPAGQIKSPDGKCLPGEGQCAQGEARGKDGTCKRDGNNDGKPDEEEEGGEGGEPGEGEKAKDEFSGGDDCNKPPSCSGSPIMCGQARIQWRIDCNTRKNRNIAGGTCATMPVCTGEKCDAVEYNSLLMQWRTACAVEKLAQGSGGGDGSQPAWTSVAGMSQDPGAGATANDTRVLTVKKLSVDDLDHSGFGGGGGGGCIGFVVGGGGGVASGFAQSLASPPAYFCNYIGLIRAVLILSAAVTCAYILSSGGKS